MLAVNPKDDPMDNPWSKHLNDDGELAKVSTENRFHLDDNDAQMSSNGPSTCTENRFHLGEDDAQKSSNDQLIYYKYCPVWEELIFVKCKYCSCHILPHSIKQHVELRHTGDVQYYKDPEVGIFHKIKKPIPPPPPPLPPNHRASTPAGVSEVPNSRTQSKASCSAEAFVHPNSTEQYLGWPKDPHGAFQLSPASVSAGANIVKVKPENKKSKKVVIPGGKADNKTTVVSPAGFKAGGSTSVLLTSPASTHKTVHELAKSVVPPPLVEKDEPYNQTFSFSAAGPLPSTSTFKIPSTPLFNLSSQDMPSTSYEMPSTSSYTGDLLPCQMLGQTSAYTPVFQVPSSIPSATVTSETQEKTPVIEKLVLRRVLQTGQKEPADRSQSNQGLKGVAKNKKDSSQTYFMVVKNKDQQQNLAVARQQIRKQTNVVHQEKGKVEKEMKKLENYRSKLINQLFQELQNVKLKLEQCNRSKQQIENKLLEVEADLEETKRTTDFQNEALLKQNEIFETEIRTLKTRIDELTNRLEKEQINRPPYHPWNFADSHQALEKEKLEYQKRIEELESDSRELQKSSTEQKGHFDAKLRQYFVVINDLKKRLDAQTAKSEDLQLQRDYYEQHLPPEISFQVKTQLAAFQQQAEPNEAFGQLTPHHTPAHSQNITSPGIPMAETLLSDIHNNYIFQSHMSPDSPEVLQQQPQQQQSHEMMTDEEVS